MKRSLRRRPWGECSLEGGPPSGGWLCLGWSMDRRVMWVRPGEILELSVAPEESLLRRSPLLPIPPVLAPCHPPCQRPASSPLENGFICFHFCCPWLPWAFVAACRPSLAAASGASSLAAELCGPLIIAEHAPRARASVAVAHGFRWSWQQRSSWPEIGPHSLYFKVDL